MGFHIISLMLINVEVLDHIAYWRPSENFRNHDFLQCVHKHEHEPNLGSQNGMIQRLSTLKAWQVDIWLPPKSFCGDPLSRINAERRIHFPLLPIQVRDTRPHRRFPKNGAIIH